MTVNPLVALSTIGHNPLLGEATNALGGWLASPPPPLPQVPVGSLVLRIWDVEHGACAMLHHYKNGVAGRLAMIDFAILPRGNQAHLSVTGSTGLNLIIYLSPTQIRII